MMYHKSLFKNSIGQDKTNIKDRPTISSVTLTKKFKPLLYELLI